VSYGTKATTRGAELGGVGRSNTVGFGGGVAGVDRHGVGERELIGGAHRQRGEREKTLRMEGVNQKRKHIPRNTPKARVGQAGHRREW
jgi:hypothetical protein